MTANHHPKPGLTIAAFCDPLGVCRIGIWRMLQRNPELAVQVPDHTRKAGHYLIIVDPDTLLDMLHKRTRGFRPGDRPPLIRSAKVPRPIVPKKKVGRPRKERNPADAGGSYGDR